MWLHEAEETLQKLVEELHREKETGTAATMQEIEVLKKAQEELKTKVMEEIIEMKKETDHLVIDKVQLFTS